MSLLDALPIALTPEQAALYRAAWPSADLLAEHVAIAAHSRLLLLGCAADPLCLVMAGRARDGLCLVADDDAAACDELMAQAHAARLANVRCVDPADLLAEQPNPFDCALGNTLYHPNKRMTAALVALAHHFLAPGGTLALVGAKQRGIVSIADEVRRVFGGVSTLALRKGHRVLAATRGPQPSSVLNPSVDALFALGTEPVESITLRGQTLQFITSPFVFASGRLDPATALLAQALDVRPEDRFADLGCGSGLLGLLAARLAPGAPVYLLDASRAAVRLARGNARLNGVTSATALAGDAIALLRRHALRPTVIATNPPFHAGQLHSTLVAHRFIMGAAERLAPEGRLLLVANRFLAYERALRGSFGEVREVGGDNRYKVLLAAAPLAEMAHQAI